MAVASFVWILRRPGTRTWVRVPYWQPLVLDPRLHAAVSQAEEAMMWTAHIYLVQVCQIGVTDPG
jgi:hypothetical protein